MFNYIIRKREGSPDKEILETNKGLESGTPEYVTGTSSSSESLRVEEGKKGHHSQKRPWRRVILT